MKQKKEKNYAVVIFAVLAVNLINTDKSGQIKYLFSFREMAEERRRSKSRKKIQLNAECFMVSRGWQLDQTRLLRSLDRLKNANFGRVQLATTINRVVENIRPHLDAVLIHIGNQELIEAAYSVFKNNSQSLFQFFPSFLI